MSADVGSAFEYAELLEEDAQDLYDHSPAGFFSTLPDGLLVKVNQTFLSWTGYEREQLVGKKRLHDLLPTGARIYYETHYAPLLRMQGAVREIALEIVCATGARLPVLMNSAVKADADGTPRVIRSSVFNASDRRRYERELLIARTDAEVRARAALALAHVAEGVILVDADGRLQLVNPAAELILAISGKDVDGRPVAEVIPGWDALVPRIPVGERERPAESVTLPVSHAGRELWLAMAAVDSGDGIVYTIRDVTADHHLERIRDDLVTVVSHELRTPLTGVRGAALTLLERFDTLDASSRRAMLELVVEQTERLTRIVNEIELTSSLDSGDLVVDVGAFDAAAVVASVTASLGAKERDRVVVTVAEGLRARGDALRMQEVLAHLVENALKYSRGTVRLGLAETDVRVRFTVADDGPGIPHAERSRVFEKFYRLDPDLRQGVGGLGLGLYVAKELVGRMGGRVGVLPTDAGAAFFVDLPRAD